MKKTQKLKVTPNNDKDNVFSTRWKTKKVVLFLASLPVYPFVQAFSHLLDKRFTE